MNFQIAQLEDWQKVVEEILPHIKHRVLLLKGNLGAGKTTFTQFLLKKINDNYLAKNEVYKIHIRMSIYLIFSIMILLNSIAHPKF